MLKTKRLIFSVLVSLAVHFVLLDVLSVFQAKKEGVGAFFINARLSHAKTSGKSVFPASHEFSGYGKNSQLLTKVAKRPINSVRSEPTQNQLRPQADQDQLYQYRINFARSLREDPGRIVILDLVSQEAELETRVLKISEQRTTLHAYTVELVSQGDTAAAIALLKKVANQNSFPAGFESITIRLATLN